MIRQRMYVEWTYRYNRFVNRWRFDPIFFVRCVIWHAIAAMLWTFHSALRTEYAAYVKKTNELGYCHMQFALWIPTKWRARIVGYD